MAGQRTECTTMSISEQVSALSTPPWKKTGMSDVCPSVRPSYGRMLHCSCMRWSAPDTQTHPSIAVLPEDTAAERRVVSLEVTGA